MRGKGAVSTATRAFTLMELMIGIVILGLGMVMVATIFPVAWHRARELSEYTSQRAIIDGANATVSSLVRVAGPKRDASSFCGDRIVANKTDADCSNDYASACPCDFPSDNWVHALNMENVQVQDRRFVPEDPWAIESANLAANAIEWNGFPFFEISFFRQQLRLHERVYPPMEPRKNVNAAGVFTGEDDRWDNALLTRRFSYSVLHRLRETVNESDLGSTRSLDVYYVVLRRTQPTHRFARQDASTMNIPSPCDVTPGPVTPKALGPEKDVMFPVPWRVQVEFPADLNLSNSKAQEWGLDPNPQPPSGIPTEIEVPPDGMPPSEATEVMVVNMFPKGTQFIDEISGLVFRVVKRRITGKAGEQAALTLDREVLLEDLDLPAGDPRCEDFCESVSSTHLFLDRAETVRTVWVFPPAVESQRVAGALVFNGPAPVVDIEVRSLSVVPTD